MSHLSVAYFFFRLGLPVTPVMFPAVSTVLVSFVFRDDIDRLEAYHFPRRFAREKRLLPPIYVIIISSL